MKNRLKNHKNIVLHDIFDIRGGGERLALSLTSALNADLCFGKKSHKSFNLNKMHQGKLINLNLKLELPGMKTWALSRLFTNKTQFLNQYDNVIYSGMICPLAIKNHSNGKNIFYCHTPPRFVYDKYEHYLKQNLLPQRLVLKKLVKWYKPQFEASINKMDVIVTNSHYVQTRIKKYLKKESIVVYPPCNTDNFSYQPSQGYYLSTARHDKLKRINEIINAFKRMKNRKLLICSSGSEHDSLVKLTDNHPNITFSGQVSDTKFNKLIAQSIATIYIPLDEDFGMSPVESMAAGKPVICSGHGGPTESVIDGETGYYINDDDIENSIIDCVTKLDSNKAASMQIACERRAQLFSEKLFHKKIQQIVNS